MDNFLSELRTDLISDLNVDNVDEYIRHIDLLNEYVDVKIETAYSRLNKVHEKSYQYGIKPYSKEEYFIARSSIVANENIDKIADDIEDEFIDANNMVASFKMDGTAYLPHQLVKAREYFKYVIDSLYKKYEGSFKEYKYYTVTTTHHNPNEIMTISLVLIRE